MSWSQGGKLALVTECLGHKGEKLALVTKCLGHKGEKLALVTKCLGHKGEKLSHDPVFQWPLYCQNSMIISPCEIT